MAVGRRVRRATAVAAARLAATLAPIAGHSGTALPGLIAERVDPAVLPSLAERFTPVVAVLGVNGKTTTTRLTATVIERATGRRPASNRSGSNLVQGIVTALLGTRTAGAPAPAVIEVDEMAFARVAAELRPDVVVLLNLVRDQLDRYGEIDSIAERWVRDLRTLPPETRVVICGDDARLEAIARTSGRPILRFGMVGLEGDDSSAAHPDRAPAATDAPAPDPPPCPGCGTRLEATTPATRAAWHCAACGLGRSALDLSVRIAGMDDSGWLVLEFGGPVLGSAAEDATARADGPIPTARVRLTGGAGAYDAAAAVLAAVSVGIDARAAIRALDRATPAFGRLEELAVADRHVVLTLAKNPASVAEAATAVQVRRPDGLLIALGDRPADGRDVSWIWDAALDGLAGLVPTTLAGDRADDLALRFKYAIRPPTANAGGLVVESELARALDASLDRVRPGGTLMVLATYTALLGIRRVLEERGLASAMPR
jgi:UDP-N-acetylmuramyl tripeptide synthase